MEKQARFLLAVFAIVLASASFCKSENLAVNSGFETYESTEGGWPSSYGDWKGDASSIVGATAGITPLEGGQMLKFTGSSFTGTSSATACQVFQVIDVSGYSELIAGGEAVISASAYFNRVAGDAQTDTQFYVVINAYQGDPSTFPSQMDGSTYLVRISTPIYTDGDPGTWELCSTELALPVNTDFVVIGLYANEDVYNDSVLPEYDGHFADSVNCEIILEGIDLVIASLVEAMAEKEEAMAMIEAAIAKQITASNAINTMIATGELEGYSERFLISAVKTVDGASTNDQKAIDALVKTNDSLQSFLSKL
jgi:hypothetical protein